jgi:hypothetical protein
MYQHKDTVIQTAPVGKYMGILHAKKILTHHFALTLLGTNPLLFLCKRFKKLSVEKIKPLHVTVSVNGKLLNIYFGISIFIKLIDPTNRSGLEVQHGHVSCVNSW